MAPADSERQGAAAGAGADAGRPQMAYRDSAPNVICAYAYEDFAGAVNRFYHETRILAEPDKSRSRRATCPHPPCQARAGGVHRSAGLLRPDRM